MRVKHTWYSVSGTAVALAGNRTRAAAAGGYFLVAVVTMSMCAGRKRIHI